jgi:hypothetical protein
MSGYAAASDRFAAEQAHALSCSNVTQGTKTWYPPTGTANTSTSSYGEYKGLCRGCSKSISGFNETFCSTCRSNLKK